MRNNGGPAFPTDARTSEREILDERLYRGMTLRDWFAGQAIMGLAALGSMEMDVRIRNAYRIADAMLAERDR